MSLGARYRSLFVLGKGGMGSVEAALEASGPENGERIVALKRLLPDAARDQRRVDMFLREARLAQMLDHPNVVRAFDYGEIEGELYLAMEYVEGQSLARILRSVADAKEELPLPVIATLVAEMCHGLHAAHELADPKTGAPLNLVHRDVSPQNVIVGYDGRVRLLDFGVAKIETENVTKTGEVKGKTAYMSPEQAMGDPLDRRSDLFGVGAVLYECLALERMWGGGTDMETIRKLALEEPPSLRKAGRDVPEAIVKLHARLVARDAKNRPASAGEVATELEALVQDPGAAKKALKDLLHAHFAEQARAQRARLEASLTDVAPEHADELRKSLTPSSSRSARSLARPESDAETLAEPFAPMGPPKRPSPVVFLIGAAIAVLAFVMLWRSLNAESGTGTTTSTSTTTGTTASAGTGTPTTTSAGPPTGTSTTTSTNTTTSTGAPLGAGAPPGAGTRAPPGTGTGTFTGAPSRTAAAPQASRPTAPSPSTKAPPPPVDPNPF